MTDLISEFMAVTSKMATPLCFRRWTAIALGSAALSREVYCEIEAGVPLYPNLYIMMVARPGVGKTRPISVARRVAIGQGKDIGLAPNKVTQERLLQMLGTRFAGIPDKDGEARPLSFFFNISEIGTLMPKADLAYMQALADLWDCPELFEYQTKNKGQDKIVDSYLVMLLGAQPAWFGEGFPPNAFDMGLPARLIVIYSDDAVEYAVTQTPVGETPKMVLSNVDPLIARVRQMKQCRGRVIFTPEALGRFQEWQAADYPPTVIDPMLQGYARRRKLHAAKVATVLALSAHPTDMSIHGADFDQALDYLFEAEKDMPKALAAAGGNIFRIRQEAVMTFVWQRYNQAKTWVPEWEVRQRMSRLVPPNLMGIIIDEMIASRDLIIVHEKGDPLGWKQRPNRSVKPNKELANAKN